jgi:hypothetical protein
MGLPEAKDTLRPSSKASLNESATSTIAPSGVPSVMEKADPTINSTTQNHDKETATDTSKELGDSEIQEKSHDDVARIEDGSEEEDDAEYPKSWKLALITIALCLSVFCMALVRSYDSDRRRQMQLPEDNRLAV